MKHQSFLGDLLFHSASATQRPALTRTRLKTRQAKFPWYESPARYFQRSFIPLKDKAVPLSKDTRPLPPLLLLYRQFSLNLHLLSKKNGHGLRDLWVG